MLLALETNESADELVESEADDTRSLRKNEVCIGVGNDSKVFVIDVLKQLPYFAVLFSDRWLKQRQELNGRTSQKINIFDNDDNSYFKLDDLVLLLKCVETNSIPSDVKLDLKQLESLLNCADFFCSCENILQESVINESKVIRYLQCRTPPITARQRKEWVVECENKIVRKALHKYNEILEKQFSMARCNTLLNRNKNDKKEENDDVKNLTSIVFDPDTAATVFKDKFEIIYSYQETDTKKLSINIAGFDKELWDHLWGLFSITDYWHYFGEDIATLVQKLEVLPNAGKCLICDNDQGNALESILSAVIIFLTTQSANNKDPNISTTVTIYSTSVAKVKLFHARRYFYYSLNNCFAAHIKLLTERECEQFLSIIISSKEFYVRLSVDKEEKDKACESWFKLFQHLLKHCGVNFLVSNAQLWFPIGHESIIKYNEYITKESWNNTIFNDIIPKFNTQLSFNFGLYLVDFVVYCDKQQGKAFFDDRYFQFLKDSIGVTWNLV